MADEATNPLEELIRQKKVTPQQLIEIGLSGIRSFATQYEKASGVRYTEADAAIQRGEECIYWYRRWLQEMKQDQKPTIVTPGGLG